MSAAENAKETLEWWKTSIIYQIYPRSFQDSTGNGVGDIKGIISRLDHFVYLGVEALWLSPVYRSPMVDFGYDISDFIDIDPMFGSLQDLDDLIEEMHRRGMKLIMDYIPNHTSNLHPWFIESRKGGADNPYVDFYVWHQGRKNNEGIMGKPNNWTSVFGGSAWTWDEVRGAYYLHQFAPEQPDLNWNNASVISKMDDVFRFWLNRGVDGFRVDAIDTMFERNYDMDEPQIEGAEKLPELDDRRLNHIYTRHQPEIHFMTRRWRNIFDEHETKTGKEIFVVTEVYDQTLKLSMKYYHTGASMPFNFNLVECIRADSGGLDFHKVIDHWMTTMPKDKWPNFVLGNHDVKRITTRKGAAYADVMNVLLLTLPGTPTTYQGEELGQLDIDVTFQDTVDPWGRNYGPELYKIYSRDCCRGPIQWDDSPNAGFSTATKTWLPAHPDYMDRNVERQTKDSTGKSSIQVYRRAAELRRRPEFRNNRMAHDVVNTEVYSYIRKQDEGGDAYLIALNVGSKTSSDIYMKDVQTNTELDTRHAEVVLVAGKDTDNITVGDRINLETPMTLRPATGLVLKIHRTSDK